MSEYRYFIKKIYQPSPDQIIFEAGDKRGRPVFNYRPGQYALISYRNSRGQVEDKHAFSLASSPNQNEAIFFGIKIQGSFTQGLLNLKVGDELRVFGPYGNFYYDERKYSDLVMIAGGIGITPFFSALNYAAGLKLNNKLSLIYSTKTKDTATFYEEIKNLEKMNPNMSALFSFTEEKGVPEDKNVIYQRVDTKVIKDFIGDIYGKTFFVCGPSLFMAAMVANLLRLGVARNQIEMEEFSMIPDRAFWPRLRNISYAMAFSVLVFIISFSLIHKSTNAAVKQSYDFASINKINQAAYERMISIYSSKNKAITDLNQQILAATKNSGGRATTNIKQPTVNTSVTSINNKPAVSITSAPPVVQSTQPATQSVQAPVYTPPAQVYTPAPTPVYTPPTPVTSASPVR